ncbi:MAG: DeoR/GlpR transcriptional regulator [Planctomycetes bacterium]|nr:DeoR/GlpR transcriptional regulator [Planctomycetota bacterium]
MPRSAAQAVARRRELVNILARRQSLSIADAAGRFGVNGMTIRRDMKMLQDSGAVLRCYGGAVAAQRITFEFAFDERRRSRLAEKRRIGRAAAGLIGDGQTAFLDTGTTTLEVARAIVARGIACRIATSSLVIASELWGREQIELVLLGGQVRRGSPDLVGPGTELMLDKLSADFAFLGSEGLDVARGSFADDPLAAQVAGHMAANAKKTVVVADHSKLGKVGSVQYLPVGDMDVLVTDKAAPAEIVAALRRNKVKVVVV